MSIRELNTRGEESVSLEDVEDVIAFARWTAGRTLAKAEKLISVDEAADEAVVLIYSLHEEWDPARCEKFSAFLLTMLPRRLWSWWKKELRQSGRGTWAGSRGEYVFYRTTSFDDPDAGIDQSVFDPA